MKPISIRPIAAVMSAALTLQPVFSVACLHGVLHANPETSIISGSSRTDLIGGSGLAPGSKLIVKLIVVAPGFNCHAKENLNVEAPSAEETANDKELRAFAKAIENEYAPKISYRGLRSRSFEPAPAGLNVGGSPLEGADCMDFSGDQLHWDTILEKFKKADAFHGKDLSEWIAKVRQKGRGVSAIYFDAEKAAAKLSMSGGSFQFALRVNESGERAALLDKSLEAQSMTEPAVIARLNSTFDSTTSYLSEIFSGKSFSVVPDEMKDKSHFSKESVAQEGNFVIDIREPISSKATIVYLHVPKAY